jgi:hypothetical protein
MIILVTGGVLYGSNIIKELIPPNIFGKKFGTLRDLIILYPYIIGYPS